MIPTITKEVQETIANYISTGISCFLINYPDLGLDTQPNTEQYNLRKMLTMERAVLYELPLGGGYKRFIPDLVTNAQLLDLQRLTINAKFIATSGPIGPFTHVCVAMATNLIGANTSNGNNRGNSSGVLIASIPVYRSMGPNNLGMTINPPTQYQITIPINITTSIL
jgi:hypothetical protein